MLTIVPPIQLRISGVNTFEIANLLAKNNCGIAFNFDKNNSKFIKPRTANEIKKQISKKARICGIFKDPTDEELSKCLNEIDIDEIQLDGNENKDRVDFIKLWFSRYPLKVHLETDQKFPNIYSGERKKDRQIRKSINIFSEKDIGKIYNYQNLKVVFLYNTVELENINYNLFPSEISSIFSINFNKKKIKSLIISKKRSIDISKGLENKMGELSFEKISNFLDYIRSDEILSLNSF